MTNTTRRTFLEKLLGKDLADETRSDLQQAAGIADEAGLERKNLDAAKAEKAIPPQEEEEEVPPQDAPAAEVPADPQRAEEPPVEEKQPVVEPPAEPVEGDPVDQAAGKLAEQIFASVEGNLNSLTAEKLQMVIAEALRPAVEGEPAEEPAIEQPTPPEEEEMVADKALSSDAQSKALDLITKMVDDQAEIAETVAGFMEEFETVKALTPVVEELAAAVRELQEQYNLRPRAASEAEENIFSTAGRGKSTAKAKEVEADIQKGLQGDGKLFLGHIPVKNTPT